MPHPLPIYAIIFYVLAAMLIASSLCMIFSKRTVQSALWLILIFLLSAILWMMLQAEFLSLVLVFVYVGAVLTLFLFVVMMIDSNVEANTASIKKVLPIAVAVLVLLLALLLSVIYFAHGAHGISVFRDAGPLATKSTAYSNTMQMGFLLYTKYVVAFELAAAILIVAIIGAISLAMLGKKSGGKIKPIAEQVRASKSAGLRIIDLPKGEQM